MAEWEPILREQMTELLAQVCEEGFEAPLYCTFLDANGSNVYGRYEETDDMGLSFTIITSHMVAEDFTLPMHVLLVDQVGEAAHVTLDVQTDPSGPSSVIWN